MVNSIRPGNERQSPLPAPNVIVARSGTPMHELSPEAIKGILSKRKWGLCHRLAPFADGDGLSFDV